MLRLLPAFVCLLLAFAPVHAQKKAPEALTPEDLQKHVRAYLHDEGKDRAAALAALVELDADALDYRPQPPGYRVSWRVWQRRSGWSKDETMRVEKELRGLLVQAVGQYQGGLLSRDFGKLEFVISIEPPRPAEYARVEQLLKDRPPEAVLILFSSGQARYWQREYEAALYHFEAALRLERDDARLWYFKGLSELELGRKATAEGSLERALELHVEGKPGREVIALALERVQGPIRVMLRQRLETRELKR